LDGSVTAAVSANVLLVSIPAVLTPSLILTCSKVILSPYIFVGCSLPFISLNLLMYHRIILAVNPHSPKDHQPLCRLWSSSSTYEVADIPMNLNVRPSPIYLHVFDVAHLELCAIVQV
jgi:hypothetical protein